MKDKSKKILFSLPEKLLAQLDSVAAEEHRSRSELIREATRRYIADRPRKRPIDDPKVRAALRSMEELAKTWREPFDSTEVIRQMRDSRYGPESDEED